MLGFLRQLCLCSTVLRQWSLRGGSHQHAPLDPVKGCQVKTQLLPCKHDRTASATSTPPGGHLLLACSRM
ncbi:unnamed protein product [Pleuronectes platessa]|uniref:Uncharacterized protein n=1 Tax=Pleuronectes platessa TaxID=8262 RepID=A0A9N7TRW9_PLEPL|nr:unnamed protein product [Pleuronectes platessa]